jgi:hypothetical protein
MDGLWLNYLSLQSCRLPSPTGSISANFDFRPFENCLQKSLKVSGKTVIAIVLAICMILVGFAFVQRSSQTHRIRGLFTAEGARLIQRSDQVWIAYGTDVNDQTMEFRWREISQAPGLIHLRATLVDDLYFQWSTLSDAEAQPDDYRYIKFRFCENEQSVEVWVNPQTGIVYSIPTQRTVRLIDSSRQAIDQYLRENRKLRQPGAPI